MALRIVAGGYRKSIALLSFEPSTAKLKVVSESPSPPNPSWVEASATHTGDQQVIYSCSEDEEHGKVFSASLKGDKLELTSERKTAAAPAHVHCMKDGSGLIVANYVGGTVAYYPIEADGTLSTKSDSPDLVFPFPYEKEEAPNKERQDKTHMHQVVETDSGDIYAVDLGGDRIWSIQREGESGLKIKGYLQCPPGSGPRHVAVSANGKHLYALTELSHELLLFSINNPTLPAHPTPNFKLSIVPDTVPKSHQKYMDSAEIQLNPAHPNVIYASNRWELHLHEKQPELPPLEPKQPGDTICVVKVSEDGGKIESVKQIRTGCDSVRGMRVSPDGKWVALAGQEGGGVEIWQISGDGTDWKLAAKEESLKGVTDLVWI